MKPDLKTRLQNTAFSSPMSVAVSAALFAVVIFSLPNLFKTGDTALFILNVVCRFIAVFLSV